MVKFQVHTGYIKQLFYLTADTSGRTQTFFISLRAHRVHRDTFTILQTLRLCGLCERPSFHLNPRILESFSFLPPRHKDTKQRDLSPEGLMIFERPESFPRDTRKRISFLCALCVSAVNHLSPMNFVRHCEYRKDMQESCDIPALFIYIDISGG